MKTRVSPLKEHGELLKELSQMIFRQASAVCPHWDEAFHDFRMHPSHSGLERTVVRTGSERTKIILPIESVEIGERLLELREQLPGSNWWGVLLRIDKHGACDVTYNYHDDCVAMMSRDEAAHTPF